MDTSEHILSMPFAELRERVELAERMALAARLTPSGTYAGESTPVNTGGATSAPAAAETPAPATRKRRTKAEIDADNAKAAAAEAGTAASEPSADDLMAAMTPEPAADTGSDDGGLSLEDIGTDDMMAGFETEEAALSPAEARQKASAIIADIQATKDTARLSVAREALVKVGFQRASDIPDDKIVEFYGLLPK